MTIEKRGYCDEPGTYGVSFPSVSGIFTIEAENGNAAVRIAQAEIRESCKAGAGGSRDGLDLRGRMSRCIVYRRDPQTPETREALYRAAVTKYHQALETVRTNRSDKNMADADKAQRYLMKMHERWMATMPQDEEG
jgi:hypothetical protein